MSGRRRVVAGVAAAVVVASGVAAYARSDNGPSKKNDLVILADVQRRTLKDSVTLTGTLARQEQRKITAVAQARVSAVGVKDGATANAGDALFSLDGRDAIAADGTVSFFRALGVGDRGDDVVQLKKILAAAGYSPGPPTPVYTEQTRFALAQWQAEHHYPGAAPVTAQTVLVSLQQSAAYTLGPMSTAGLVVGPSGTGAVPAAATGGAPARATLAIHRTEFPSATLLVQTTSTTTTAPPVTPAVTIQSAAAVVDEGAPATFVVTLSEATTVPVDVNVAVGGSATSDDIVVPPAAVTVPPGARSTQVQVQTRADDRVEPDKTITLSVAGGSGYLVGSPDRASTTLVDANVPELYITGGTAVAPGGSVTLQLTADQAPLKDTQVSLAITGDAVPGTDYRTIRPTIVLPAGQSAASVTIDTLASDTIQPDRHLAVAISPASGYRVGSPGVAAITILGEAGDAALPVVTLQSATARLQKGQPYPLTVTLSRAASTPTTIRLQYGGSAVAGVDFVAPGGSIVVPAGQTSLAVTVPTVVDELVAPDRVLIVSLANSTAYRVGAPSSVSVTIESQVVPTLTISASTASVPVGGAATFTIHADQPPVKDTSVNYQVGGTAQPGQDFRPLLGTAVLRAGERDVTVTLRSLQRDVVFEPTDMIVGQWPIRIGQVFVKEGDAVPPGTAVLSLTDPNFTVTLQASASDRTKL
ncbi:MAG TPA: Calx-beta domain-containing protein, partial [Actinoplanes sp.]|nr:Calx-beta domain-containing protein [Actinoplanes sp.]